MIFDSWMLLPPDCCLEIFILERGSKPFGRDIEISDRGQGGWKLVKAFVRNFVVLLQRGQLAYRFVGVCVVEVSLGLTVAPDM